MKKLWHKDWTLDSFIEAFETAGDLVLDQKLVKADVVGTLAHANMLFSMGILTKTELEKVEKGLVRIVDLWQQGTFVLEMGDEDVHTKIEQTLTVWYGDIGKKIHTARSRNDQVLTALRLYTREQMLVIWDGTIGLASELLRFTKTYEMIPMPGYTHMQKAMPSSVGLWAESFVEALFDSLILLKTSYDLVNQSPLGSAAAYGVPISIDREYTAKLLGFAKVQKNSLYCQNSRGVVEAAVVASLVYILQIISKFAADVVLFTTSEFHLFTVDANMCSGSSIMPQKKNVDVAELLRAKVHIVLAHYVSLVGVTSGLPSGYNRDLQETKKPLMESLETTYMSLKAAALLVSHLSPDKEACMSAMTPELYATRDALHLVLSGTPFREAYEQVAQRFKNSGKSVAQDFVAALHESRHTGSTGNLGLAALYTELAKYTVELKKVQAEVEDVYGILFPSSRKK